ncbi:hypothetical protein DFR67_110239 [Williamsia limnetica]|jgi:hypothetical protein|uniref:Uncharacterized protein n=1 Tax=Williamsia limnetica TaxID=882452 RepID=A0A318RMF7_WILLI|nr:hypothetical protein DFR67_110239 [Williamsia limnetica]
MSCTIEPAAQMPVEPQKRYSSDEERDTKCALECLPVAVTAQA